MPTLSSMQIPPPKSWEEFEEITLSCLKIKWESPNLTKHGRQGQPQAGVDIYGMDDLGRVVGIQCKLTNEITFSTITEEIAKAENFSPLITTFFVATDSSSDVKLQQKVRLLSEERIKQKRFPVGLFFWEDLIQELIKNPSEFKKHYPEISVAQIGYRPSGARLLSLLDIAYFGLSLNYYMGLIFGDIGRLAGEDPYQIQVLANIVENCATILFDSAESSILQQKMEELTTYSLSFVFDTEVKPAGWEPVIMLANYIERFILNLQYRLTSQDLAIFRTGVLLAKWKNMVLTRSDEKLSMAEARVLLETIKLACSDSSTLHEIQQKINTYNDEMDRHPMRTMDTPEQIYSLIRNVIILQEIQL